MFANLRFSTVLATDRGETVHLADYFGLRVALVSVAVVGLAIWCSIRGGFGIEWLLAVITLCKAVEAINELCCGVQQRIERMDRIAISLGANAIAISAAFAVIYYLTRNLTLAAVGHLGSTFGCLVGIRSSGVALGGERDRLRWKGETRSELAYRGSWNRMQRLLIAAAPLGVTAALVSLTFNIPRYIIRAEHSREMLGLFASVAVVMQAGALVFRAVEQPALPRLARFLERRDAYGFWGLLFRLCCLFFVMGLGCCVASLVLGPLRPGDRFYVRLHESGWGTCADGIGDMRLAIAGMIESSLIAARVTAVQVPMHCITAITCFGLCRLLVPTMELYGAVLAVAVCRFPFMLVGVWFLREKLRAPKLDRTKTVPLRLAESSHRRAA